MTLLIIYISVIEQLPRPMPWMRRFRGGGDRVRMFMRNSGPRILHSAMGRMPERSFTQAAKPVIPLSLPSSSSSVLAPVQKVRKLFPETWLWAVATIP